MIQHWPQMPRSWFSCIHCPTCLRQPCDSACDSVYAKNKRYTDPATGYRVFSEHGHRRRGRCCGNVSRRTQPAPVPCRTEIYCYCYSTPPFMRRLTPARFVCRGTRRLPPASCADTAPLATSTCPTASAPRRGPRARRPSPRRRCCAGASRRGRGMRRPTGPLASPPALPRT